MNKAFVREPDDNGQRHCPRCGSLGTSVGAETVARHLRPAVHPPLGDAAFFCPFPTCEVVYFDLFERFVTTAELAHPVWPKDPDAPVCGCFGLKQDDIEADVREGGVRRVRALLEKAKTPEAHCALLSASGHSCVPEVQRLYLKLRGG